MRYVDGYLLPISKKRVGEYRRIARAAGKVWREHGALEYMECVADDLNPGFGLSFTKSVKLKPGETVIFAFVVFRSRAHRDRVNAKVMKDPRIANIDPASMPVDGKRMVWGGFKALVDL